MKKLLTALLFIAPLLLMAQPPKEKKVTQTTVVELKDVPANEEAPLPPPPPPPPMEGNDDIIALPVSKATKKGGPVYTVVEKMPQFPGGEDSLLTYLGHSIKYPNKARNANTQGTIYITFIINEDGSVSDAEILRGISGRGAEECNEEALRVVKGMPNWIPGKQNGKYTRVQYNLPIKFTVR